MNKAILIGRTTKDIEFSTTTSGISVAKFTLAIERRFKNADGEYDTDFLNIVVWRSTAEFAQKYIKKGDKVGVVGSIQTRSYDAQDGTKRYVTEIVADEIELLSPKPKTADKENEKSVGIKASNDTIKVDDDSLPF